MGRLAQGSQVTVGKAWGEGFGRGLREQPRLTTSGSSQGGSGDGGAGLRLRGGAEAAWSGGAKEGEGVREGFESEGLAGRGKEGEGEREDSWLESEDDKSEGEGGGAR